MYCSEQSWMYKSKLTYENVLLANEHNCYTIWGIVGVHFCASSSSNAVCSLNSWLGRGCNVRGLFNSKASMCGETVCKCAKQIIILAWVNWDQLLLQALKSFLDSAEAVVRSLISLYAEVVRPCYKVIFLFAPCVCERFWWHSFCREEMLIP